MLKLWLAVQCRRGQTSPLMFLCKVPCVTARVRGMVLFQICFISDALFDQNGACWLESLLTTVSDCELVLYRTFLCSQQHSPAKLHQFVHSVFYFKIQLLQTWSVILVATCMYCPVRIKILLQTAQISQICPKSRICSS